VPIVLHAINAAGGVVAADTVLVTGANGTLGRVAVELLLHLGATVIAASRRSVEHPGVTTVLTSELGASQARVAIDVSGHGPTIAAAVRALGWNGTAVTVSASLEPGIPLDGRDLVLQRKTLIGVGSADYAEVAEGIALVRRGIAVPRIAVRFPLENAADAYRAFGNPDRDGKVIIDV
jgi:propanol-preferring alcohol dehydrogenase